MANFVKAFCMLILCVLTLAACRSIEGNHQGPLESPLASTTTVQETETVPSQTPGLATPYSQEPAAGICGSFEDEVVVITINPDIPDPRCVIIAPDQILKVVNNRQETLQVSIANMEATIEPGSEHTFNVPFGQYLAPGVHLIEVKPCCGASLWLK
jgi:predicted small lipoprotein YifL